MRRMKSDSRKLRNKYGQMWLDVGCGENKQSGCVGMDRRKVTGVDVVHDAERIPWPFPDRIFDRVILSHVMEHLKPWLVNDIMDEMWRVLKAGGQLMIAMPYAGSFGFYQDPTHVKAWNEATATYFDPEHASKLYDIYKPKPWKIEANVWRMDGNLEVVFSKRSLNGNTR